jgi:hypothetical protein
MNQGQAPPAITVFAGRFGSGKTEVSINYAVSLAQKQPTTGKHGVVLIDLDIVTPYFRSRETAAQIETRGVKVIAPSIIGHHLDTPAITPQILGAIEQSACPVVLDVGGDKQGARALGQFAQAIQGRKHVVYFVVNPYRPFTGTEEGLASSIAEIEASSRLEVTALVSNPNIIGDTRKGDILSGHARVETFAQHVDLPIAFVCMERRWSAYLGPADFGLPTLALDRYFAMPWEEAMAAPQERHKEKE